MNISNTPSYSVLLINIFAETSPKTQHPFYHPVTLYIQVNRRPNYHFKDAA